jgi:hypothetical protein
LVEDKLRDFDSVAKQKADGSNSEEDWSRVLENAKAAEIKDSAPVFF